MSDETARRIDDPAADETPAAPGSATAPETSTAPETGATGATTAVDDSFVKVPEADAARASAADAEERMELLDRGRSEAFRRRWDDIQAQFVDRPRESVEQADRLVLEVVQQLQAAFAGAREGLESQWDRGDDASTEDLRVTLRRYRSFFDRLLAA